MISSNSHHLTKSTFKETAFDKLPRTPCNPLVEAERQGFDDGYFGNPKCVQIHKDEIKKSYAQGYEEGKAQREVADRRKKKK